MKNSYQLIGIFSNNYSSTIYAITSTCLDHEGISLFLVCSNELVMLNK